MTTKIHECLLAGPHLGTYFNSVPCTHYGNRREAQSRIPPQLSPQILHDSRCGRSASSSRGAPRLQQQGGAMTQSGKKEKKKKLLPVAIDT